MVNVADGTRARTCQRNAEEGDAAEGHANAGPEIILPNNVDEDNPPVPINPEC